MPPHIFTYTDLYLCQNTEWPKLCRCVVKQHPSIHPIPVSGLFISLWVRLIRFSYATNISRPEGSGCMQATYSNRKQLQNVSLDITPSSEQQVRLVNGELVYT